MQDVLIPDPLNPEYAVDLRGRLYIHTFVESGSGQKIDIGYSLVKGDS